MSAPCPVCTGIGHSLGVLGNTEHYRCESCGWEFSSDEDAEYADDEHAIFAGFADGPNDY